MRCIVVLQLKKHSMSPNNQLCVSCHGKLEMLNVFRLQVICTEEHLSHVLGNTSEIDDNDNYDSDDSEASIEEAGLIDCDIKVEELDPFDFKPRLKKPKNTKVAIPKPIAFSVSSNVREKNWFLCLWMVNLISLYILGTLLKFARTDYFGWNIF